MHRGDADAPAGAGVAVGHTDRRRLVAGGHEAGPAGVQGGGDDIVAAADHPEDPVGAQVNERAGDCLPDVHWLHSSKVEVPGRQFARAGGVPGRSSRCFGFYQ
jgi:hypothetical protein